MTARIGVDDPCGVRVFKAGDAGLLYIETNKVVLDERAILVHNYAIKRAYAAISVSEGGRSGSNFFYSRSLLTIFCELCLLNRA